MLVNISICSFSLRLNILKDKHYLALHIIIYTLFCRLSGVDSTLNAQSDCLFFQSFGSEPEIDSSPSYWEDPEGITYNQYEVITPDKVGLWKYYRVNQETGSKETISERYIYCIDQLDPRSTKSTDQKIKLYPNPVSSELIVQHNITNSTIEIRNVNGGLLKLLSNGQMNFTIDVSDFQSGIYVISIISEQKVISELFVVR